MDKSASAAAHYLQGGSSALFTQFVKETSASECFGADRNDMVKLPIIMIDGFVIYIVMAESPLVVAVRMARMGFSRLDKDRRIPYN